MKFWRTFLGSFYLPEVYREARYNATGWGLRYSIWLFLLIDGSAIGLAVLVLGAGLAPIPLHLPSMLFIFCIALGIRALMLFVLAICAQLIALVLKPRMGYAAGFRLAGIAYTPMAVFDVIAITGARVELHPALLLGGGVIMLLAALRATQ